VSLLNLCAYAFNCCWLLVFSPFCSIFSCNPSFISVAHPSATSCAHPLCRCLSVAPSLFPGAVGQKRKKGKKESSQKKEKENPKKQRPPHSPSGKREPIRLGERGFAPQFPLARTLSGLHCACPGSCFSLIVLCTPTLSLRLSFPIPYSEFDLTLERERVVLCSTFGKSVCGTLL
jgi:hypothetical protein